MRDTVESLPITVGKAAVKGQQMDELFISASKR